MLTKRHGVTQQKAHRCGSLWSGKQQNAQFCLVLSFRLRSAQANDSCWVLHYFWFLLLYKAEWWNKEQGRNLKRRCLIQNDPQNRAFVRFDFLIPWCVRCSCYVCSCVHLFVNNSYHVFYSKCLCLCTLQSARASPIFSRIALLVATKILRNAAANALPVAATLRKGSCPLDHEAVCLVRPV